jgi:hypothetical protein
MDWEEVCRLRQHYCISLLLYCEFLKHKLQEPRLNSSCASYLLKIDVA